jgi:hypothetical protein
MKIILLTLLCFIIVELRAQSDQNLAASGSGDLRFIIGIVIVILVIIAMYVLLRKDDK